MARQDNDSAAIEAEVEQIRLLGLDALRARWFAMFKKSPPPALTKGLLAGMIAYRIQEQAYGGLDRATIKLLDSLARSTTPGTELKRHLKNGTVLIREYQGERHTVIVVHDGFLWRENTYASLSTIAAEITGTNWNGPRFFGLRATAARAQQSHKASPSAPKKPTAASRAKKLSVSATGRRKA